VPRVVNVEPTYHRMVRGIRAGLSGMSGRDRITELSVAYPNPDREIDASVFRYSYVARGPSGRWYIPATGPQARLDACERNRTSTLPAVVLLKTMPQDSSFHPWSSALPLVTVTATPLVSVRTIVWCPRSRQYQRTVWPGTS
jgi:hypothetical protein